MKPQEGTVFIVDDDAAVRDSLRMLMKSVAMPTVLFSSATEFLQAWMPGTSGCLVLDVRMPGMSGLELQKELIKRRITLPVIFVTGHGDVQMAVETLHLGAYDFLQKPFRDDDLLGRIRNALAQEAADRKANEQIDTIRSRMNELTPRELEIARRLAEGQANKVVALELDISTRTVELHRARIMEKMGIRSLAQLVRLLVTVGEI